MIETNSSSYFSLNTDLSYLSFKTNYLQVYLNGGSFSSSFIFIDPFLVDYGLPLAEGLLDLQLGLDYFLFLPLLWSLHF